MRRLPVILGLATTLLSCGGEGDGSNADQLPPVALSPLAPGQPTLRLDELEGPAVVNLWATWCGPCRRELPDLQQASIDRPDVRFVGVDIGEDAAAAQGFLDELGVTFPQFVDPDGELTDALGTASLPVTLIIDGDERIATSHVGPIPLEELHAALDAAG